jgi:hypothetical protein
MNQTETRTTIANPQDLDPKELPTDFVHVYPDTTNDLIAEELANEAAEKFTSPIEYARATIGTGKVSVKGAMRLARPGELDEPASKPDYMHQ